MGTQILVSWQKRPTKRSQEFLENGRFRPEIKKMQDEPWTPVVPSCLIACVGRQRWMNSMKDTWAYIDVLSEDGIIQDKKVLNMIYYFVEKKSNVLQIIGSN